MFFKKKKKDTATIVKHLSLLRVSRDGKSLFLENDAIETDAVLGFMEKCGISHHRFKMAEDILRFANAYNALVVLLRLKNNALEQEILENLRTPSVFLKNSGRHNAPDDSIVKENLAFIEKGFAMLMDNLSLSEREINVGANEMLAARFMNFLSEGRLGVEDDKPAWLAFGFAIYQDLNRLPQEIERAKRKLGLK